MNSIFVSARRRNIICEDFEFCGALFQIFQPSCHKGILLACDSEVQLYLHSGSILCPLTFAVCTFLKAWPTRRWQRWLLWHVAG